MGLFNQAGQMSLPAVQNNLYYAVNGTFAITGTIIDSQPVFGNPGFTNAAAANYSLTNSSATATIGFQPIDPSQVGPQ